MDELVLDKVLTELSKKGTREIEVTDDLMKSMGLKTTSVFHSDEVAFLKNKGYVHQEKIPYYQDHQGGFHPARYLIGLTPEGLKFITEGGYTAKTGYAKKTLTVARQSRNWAIVGVGIALIALFSQVYYGSCNSSISPNDKKQSPLPISDTTVKTADITRKQKDSIKPQNVLYDSLIKVKSKKPKLKNKHTALTKPRTTWDFMQVGLDKQNFSQLQSLALVRSGQTSLSFCS